LANELRCTRPIKKLRKRQACNGLANEYEVTLSKGGRSYTARETLCVKHKLAAEKEGFTLKALESEK
jgi:hypothetical protein